MNRVVFDCETDGLLPELTTVHCLVLKDLETGEVLSCTDDDPDRPPIQEGLEVLSQAERIYAHNGIGFDIPALQKVYPEWTYQGRLMDTLVTARLRWAHVKEQDFSRARKGKLPSNLIGSHSLEAWGHRLGIHKGEFGKTDSWAEWTPLMQTYCEQDVEVTEALVRKIRKAGALPPDALKTDHEVNWYLTQQERNGWPIDFEAAVRLQAQLAQRRQELEEKLIDHFGTWVQPKRKDGEIVEFTPKVSNSRYGYVEGCSCSRLEIKEFNPGSRQHIYNRLINLYGWEPEEFTPSGQPKVSEDVLKSLDYPMTDELVEYLTVKKRLGQVSEGNYAWLQLMEDDQPEGGAITGLPHIHHSCTQTTITHRHRHAGPNLGQVPSITSEYGEECRAVFTVPDGWALVGSDASGLELRCLAHYMARWDDGEYGKIILEGDIHAANRDALGLEGKEGRYNAKTFIYAYLYGAGNTKLGSILHPTKPEGYQAKAGKKLRRNFEAKIPALGRLSNAVQRKAKRAGYVELIDGRRAYIRSAYAALNTLLQGTGSIVCKLWIREFNKRLMERYGTPPGGGWLHPWAALAWVHDEVQIAVNLEKADPEEVGQILVESLRDLTDYLSFRLPLDGEFMTGNNWSETH